MLKRIIIFAVISLFVAACVSYAQNAPAVNSKEQAAALMKEGRYEEAFNMYSALLWNSPNDDEINTGMAEAAIKSKKYYPAIMAYERLALKYPRNMGIRKGLAEAYLLAGDKSSAGREIEFLMQNNVDTSTLVSEGLLDKSISLIYGGRIAVGGIYDTNANVGLSSGQLNSFIYLPDSEATPSAGAYALAALNGLYHLSGGWWAIGDLSGFYRYNFSSSLPSNNDVLIGRAALGGRYSTANFYADLRVKGETANTDNKIFDDQKATSYGADGSFNYRISGYILSLLGSVEQRTYNIATDRGGTYWWAGLNARWMQKIYELMAGGRILGATTDAYVYNFAAWEFTLRGALYLASLDVAPFVIYRNEQYGGYPTILDADKRHDKQIRAGASLTYHFTDNWMADLTYQYTNNDSNSVLYSYDQHYTSLSAVFNF